MVFSILLLPDAHNSPRCLRNAGRRLRPSGQSSRSCARQERIGRRQTRIGGCQTCVPILQTFLPDNNLPTLTRATRNFQAAGPSRRENIDELVNVLIGSNSRVDSGLDTPISSTPGTPALGQPISLPGTSSILSGRLSRQSDAASDRLSLGTTLIQSQNGATESLMERYVYSAVRSRPPAIELHNSSGR